MRTTETKVMAAVGHLSSTFAELDSELVDCVALLLNDSDLGLGRIVAERLSFGRTVNLLSDLVQHGLSKEAQREFKTLAKQLLSTAKLRNEIIHSSFAFSLPKEADRVMQGRSRDLNASHDDHDASDFKQRLEASALEMWQVYEDLVRFKCQYLC